MRFATLCLVAGLAAIGQVAGAPCPPKNLKPMVNIQLGPRPYYLVDNMSDGELKTQLSKCKEKTMSKSTWSFGHRGGAPLQMPEHSLESNLAGARMGAGVLECDVTFTKDLQLVCRHSQCDLHTTTNIVAVEALNKKCTEPFTPADPATGKNASANCCTSDITRDEFMTLCAKMDSFNPKATTAKEYLGGGPSWRTTLYSTCGTVLDHKAHIDMVERLGLQHTPELKLPAVPMPFHGHYTSDMYRLQMIENYEAAKVPASRVWAQSFQPEDIMVWKQQKPEYGNNAMLLDDSGDTPETYALAVQKLAKYAADGITTVAPPINYLVKADGKGNIVAADYATEANRLKLKMIAWSLDRSPPMAEVHEKSDYYYRPIKDVVTRDGDVFRVLDVLHKQAKISAIFSDWSATTTFYANCMGIGLQKNA